MMLKSLPPWVRSGIICLIVGAAGGGGLVLQITKPDTTVPPNSNSNTSTPKVSPTVSSNNKNDARVIVKDAKDGSFLEGVLIKVPSKESGTVERITDSDGNTRVRIPEVKLGEVNITLSKEGYKTKTTLLNFAAYEDEPIYINLDPSEGSSGSLAPDGKTPISNDFKPEAKIKAKSEYTEGEPIEVTYSFSDVPSNYQKIVRVAAASTPEDSIGIYRENVGNSGSVKFSGLKPGEYKIRTFYMYQPWQFKLISETPFTVK